MIIDPKLRKPRGKWKLTSHRISSVLMELLIQMTGKKRKAIAVNFNYHKRKLSNYDDVIRYIEKFIQQRQSPDTSSNPD